METGPVDRPLHGHHQVAAAIFVASLILAAAIILSAELMKPARFEFHPGIGPSTYVIYDRDTGRATPAEYHSKRGWGHSTYEAGARLAKKAGVRRLALYHHSPERDDKGIEKLVAAAKKLHAGTFAAREGLEVSF